MRKHLTLKGMARQRDGSNKVRTATAVLDTEMSEQDLALLVLNMEIGFNSVTNQRLHLFMGQGR